MFHPPLVSKETLNISGPETHSTPANGLQDENILQCSAGVR